MMPVARPAGQLSLQQLLQRAAVKGAKLEPVKLEPLAPAIEDKTEEKTEENTEKKTGEPEADSNEEKSEAATTGSHGHFDHATDQQSAEALDTRPLLEVPAGKKVRAKAKAQAAMASQAKLAAGAAAGSAARVAQTGGHAAVVAAGQGADASSPDAARPAAKRPRSAGFYELSAEDRAAILTSKKSSDVPVAIRNRVYAAIGRFVQKPTIDKETVKKWELASEGGQTGKFEFLQQFAKDTSGSSISMSEVHTKSAMEYDDTKFEWLTKWDLLAKKNAYLDPMLMRYCEKLLSAAKQRRHHDPKHKSDPDMMLYRVLRSSTEGSLNEKTRSTSLKIEADVDPDAASEVISLFANEGAKKNEDEPGSGQKQKPQKMPLHEQRFKKLQIDTATAEQLATYLDVAKLKYTTEIIDNSRNGRTQLLDLSHNIHDLMLKANTAEADSLWLKVAVISAELSRDINLGNRRMNPGAKAYSTPFDGALPKTH